MIISDDQAWTDFGFMGHPQIATPNLDTFADEAAVFPNGYVPTSLCRASLATLLTGLHGSQHKICCNDPPEGVDRSKMLPFMQEAPALPRLLREAGYASLQTGKFWEGHYRNAGFTHDMQRLEDIGANVTHQWVRSRNWKLISPVHPTKAPNEGLRFQAPRLYHLGQDPTETQNVAGRQSGVVRDLLVRLEHRKYKST